MEVLSRVLFLVLVAISVAYLATGRTAVAIAALCVFVAERLAARRRRG
jgi:uncharacterized membrane protein